VAVQGTAGYIPTPNGMGEVGLAPTFPGVDFVKTLKMPDFRVRAIAGPEATYRFEMAGIQAPGVVAWWLGGVMSPWTDVMSSMGLRPPSTGAFTCPTATIQCAFGTIDDNFDAVAKTPSICGYSPHTNLYPHLDSHHICDNPLDRRMVDHRNGVSPYMCSFSGNAAYDLTKRCMCEQPAWDPKAWDIYVRRETTLCGNGVRVAPEECDDGNTIGGDGCGPSCKVEFGFTCAAGTGPGGVDVCATWDGCQASGNVTSVGSGLASTVSIFADPVTRSAAMRVACIRQRGPRTDPSTGLRDPRSGWTVLATIAAHDGGLDATNGSVRVGLPEAANSQGSSRLSDAEARTALLHPHVDDPANVVLPPAHVLTYIFALEPVYEEGPDPVTQRMRTPVYLRHRAVDPALFAPMNGSDPLLGILRATTVPGQGTDGLEICHEPPKTSAGASAEAHDAPPSFTECEWHRVGNPADIAARVVTRYGTANATTTTSGNDPGQDGNACGLGAYCASDAYTTFAPFQRADSWVTGAAPAFGVSSHNVNANWTSSATTATPFETLAARLGISGLSLLDPSRAFVPIDTLWATREGARDDCARVRAVPVLTLPLRRSLSIAEASELGTRLGVDVAELDSLAEKSGNYEPAMRLLRDASRVALDELAIRMLESLTLADVDELEAVATTPLGLGLLPDGLEGASSSCGCLSPPCGSNTMQCACATATCSAHPDMCSLFAVGGGPHGTCRAASLAFSRAQLLAPTPDLVTSATLVDVQRAVRALAGLRIFSRKLTLAEIQSRPRPAVEALAVALSQSLTTAIDPGIDLPLTIATVQLMSRATLDSTVQTLVKGESGGLVDKVLGTTHRGSPLPTAARALATCDASQAPSVGSALARGSHSAMGSYGSHGAHLGGSLWSANDDGSSSTLHGPHGLHSPHASSSTTTAGAGSAAANDTHWQFAPHDSLALAAHAVPFPLAVSLALSRVRIRSGSDCVAPRLVRIMAKAVIEPLTMAQDSPTAYDSEFPTWRLVARFAGMGNITGVWTHGAGYCDDGASSS
jgi:cysteine-rich repeat protein